MAGQSGSCAWRWGCARRWSAIATAAEQGSGGRPGTPRRKSDLSLTAGGREFEERHWVKEVLGRRWPRGGAAAMGGSILWWRCPSETPLPAVMRMESVQKKAAQLQLSSPRANAAQNCIWMTVKSRDPHDQCVRSPSMFQVICCPSCSVLTISRGLVERLEPAACSQDLHIYLDV